MLIKNDKDNRTIKGGFMFVKLPLEVEVPDEVEVGGLVLSCKQEDESTVRYSNPGSITMTILIDLASGEIKGYPNSETMLRGTFNVDGEWLYEGILDMADAMNEELKKSASAKKSTSKPQSFNDMVKKQRNKIAKIDPYKAEMKQLMGEMSDACEVLRNLKNRMESYDLMGDASKIQDMIVSINTMIESTEFIYDIRRPR